MKRNMRSKDMLSSYRAQVDPDDGRDPRDFFKKENDSGVKSRKAQQLCAQVAETLQQLLGESGDELLQSLQVIDVAPAPDASQLLVIVAPAIGATLCADEALAVLARAGGWLRSELATAITRKRTPRLVFRAIPATKTEVQP